MPQAGKRRHAPAGERIGGPGHDDGGERQSREGKRGNRDARERCELLEPVDERTRLNPAGIHDARRAGIGRQRA